MRAPAAVFALVVAASSIDPGSATFTAFTVFATFAASASQIPQPAQPGQPAPGQPTPGQQTPPRGVLPRPGEQVPAGTAILRGQVTSTDGTPLRRAQVRAISQDGRPSGGTSSTDAQGKFEIKEVAAGRYIISASKAGFVTMQFGQRRADQMGGGTVLAVLDGQLVEKIGFSLPRGGVVTGRIMDEFGEPIAGVQVSAVRSRYMNGQRRMMPASSDNTDDLGNYRIYGLAPGEYYVQGTIRPQMMVMMSGMSATNDTDGYAPSYYPGTPNVGEAARVAVKGGQELTGMNFALVAAQLARVKGRVTNAAGEPAASVMIMVSSSDPTTNMMNMMMSSAQTRADGTFQLSALPPGGYTLTARQMMNPLSGEVGQARVTLASDDVDNVLIVISKGAVARGIITTDEGTVLPLKPQQVRLFAQSLDPTPDFSGSGMPPAANEDWTFEYSGLVGPRLLRAMPAESGDWSLKSVRLRDQDVTDTPVEFVPGQTIEGFEIVFTRKVTEVTGAIRDDRGQPVLDSTIVIFPDDRTRWTFNSRYVRQARADQQGRYRLRNLPPYDEYRVVAVRDLEEGRWSDPEFLESVRESAARVSVLEGGTAVQDLKVTRMQ